LSILFWEYRTKAVVMNKRARQPGPRDNSDHPLMHIIGIGENGPRDGGTEYDAYLYGIRKINERSSI